LADERFHRERDEVRGIARVGRALPHLGEDRHRDFGEIIEDEVLYLALLDELARRRHGIAPIAGGAADTHDLLAHGASSLTLRPARRSEAELAGREIAHDLLGTAAMALRPRLQAPVQPAASASAPARPATPVLRLPCRHAAPRSRAPSSSPRG